MAFRLVGFREGSGIATIEPDIADEPDTLFEDLPAPTENLEAMLDAMERRELPEVVNEALTRACGALGTGGTIKVTSRQRSHPVMIDAERLAEMRPEARPTPPRATSISGRLHLVDVEPDRIGIRASSGIDWICDYPEELEELVTGLVGQIVWVAGEGEQTSARRGSMRIDEVRAVEQGDQSEFFTWAPVDDAELMDRQGIREPQGLERVAEGGWDAETDQAYLDALTSG
ncbi:MAG: hypothetical protein QOI10_2197 [Solirubrobacterales bacterium]|nr:hypothetical protein [Solirubrobacterales bacterium]